MPAGQELPLLLLRDDINSSRANYDQSIGTTSDVGQYAPNPWGFYDMHGNVWEWTADWLSDYSGNALIDPEGPALSTNRVVRGGTWAYDSGFFYAPQTGEVILPRVEEPISGSVWLFTNHPWIPYLQNWDCLAT